ncbi:MAG: toxin-antitoxin system YwqK family antitoxin [Maribacter sp.]
MYRSIPLKSIQKIIFILLFAVINTAVFAQQDTLYYKLNWSPTVKDSASFFRPPVTKEGELFRIQDYYMNGQIQMNGVSKSSEKDLWEGKVTWYNEDGSIFQEGNYENNRLEGNFITYMDGKKLVANYKNGRVVSGKRNTPYGGSQMYFEQEGDTLHEIIYDKDITGIREEHYGTKESYRFLSKYYDAKGKLIGERKVLPNGYHKGVEVFYYRDPMRVKDINYYPYGELLITARYYANGQVREEVTQEPNWSKTYYDLKGKVLGKMVFEMKNNRLRALEGTEIFFNYAKKKDEPITINNKRTYEDGKVVYDEYRYENGQIKTKTEYEEGTRVLQVSYDENGKETDRMVYKDYRPFQGTENIADKKATYQQGKLVEEIIYYFETKKPKLRKTLQLETYYDIDGNVLGELKLKDDNGYPVPYMGQRFSIGYKTNDISNIEEYKDGVRVKLTSFRKRQTGKNESETYKRIEEFDNYSRIKETKFYSNGKKQSEIEYKKYKEIYGKFYDEKEQLMGSYDYQTKDGTRYQFFGDSDELEIMEEHKDGKEIRKKLYTYGKEREFGQINAVLIEDIDINCCAAFYDNEGNLISELTFKGQKPWDGIFYDVNAREKYTIKNGKRNGTYQKLDYDKKVIEEGQFVDDKEEGTFTYYDYQSNVQRKENFSAGVLNGMSTYYDKDGKVISEIDYKNGLPINGTKISSLRYGKEPNQEIYKDGTLIQRISFDKNGKSVTYYTSKTESRTIAYHKDSDKKRLSYGEANKGLQGAVIRYDLNGEEQNRAEFDNGKLKLGTVFLFPRYGDNKILYLELKKSDGKLFVKYIDIENKVVLRAEELLEPGSTPVYLKKLDLNLDYVYARDLY